MCSELLAQRRSVVLRLSERNVVELVTKLVELKLIEVLYTSDGKEYITPQHLAKEIRDELTVHGGVWLFVCVCVCVCVCVAM